MDVDRPDVQEIESHGITVRFVSIGRVEVRAIMPPVAAPKPTPPSAPKLSLEDYLKQRNGGKS